MKKDTHVSFKVKGRPIEFWLVDEGGTLCLMADDFYVLGFKPDGRVVAYSCGANGLNGLDADEKECLKLSYCEDDSEYEECDYDD